MKKRKFNILLNIAVLCMCVCAIAIGVYSAKTASLNVSGTIGFNAHNCEIAIKGEMNAYEKLEDGTNQAVTKYFNSTNAEGGEAKQITGSSDPWNIGNVYFDDLNTDKYHEVNDIVFTFTITNESAYYVDVTVDQNCINDNRIFIYAPNNGETLAPKDQTGSSVTLTVKLQLQKVNGEYSSLGTPISLSNATLLNFEKSQAPAYLATDWKDIVIDSFSTGGGFKFMTKKVSLLMNLESNTLSGFVTNEDGTYKSVSVGAVNETSTAGNLTENVSDVVAYYNSTNKEVVVYSPARIYAPQSNYLLFSEFINLTSLDLTNFDTSKVTKMAAMFNMCSSLTSLNLSNFDTSNVTEMNKMFYSSYNLTSLNLTNFDTGKVTNMGKMFYGCSALTSLNLNNFDASSVTDMSNMFSNCSALTSLNLSNINTSSVVNMGSMFYSCSELKTIYVNSSIWSTASVMGSNNMFSGCTSLPNFDENVIDKTNAHTGEGGYLTEKA